MNRNDKRKDLRAEREEQNEQDYATIRDEADRHWYELVTQRVEALAYVIEACTGRERPSAFDCKEDDGSDPIYLDTIKLAYSHLKRALEGN